MRPSLVSTRRSRALALTPAVALLLGACSHSDATQPQGYCTAAYTPAVLVTITDSLTGKTIADSATGFIASGTSINMLHRFGVTDSVLAGDGGPGTYSVLVSRPGYADWKTSGVVVVSTGFCSTVVTVALAARMIR